MEPSKRDDEQPMKPDMVPRRVVDPHHSELKKSNNVESAGAKATTRIAGMCRKYGNQNIIGGLGFFNVGGICKECGWWRVSLQNVNSSKPIVAITLFWEIKLLFLFFVV